MRGIGGAWKGGRTVCAAVIACPTECNDFPEDVRLVGVPFYLSVVTAFSLANCLDAEAAAYLHGEDWGVVRPVCCMEAGPRRVPEVWALARSC